MSTGPVWASNFPDDGTFLATPSELPTMPSQGSYGFFALCYRNLNYSSWPPGVMLQNIADQYFDNTVWISWFRDDAINPATPLEFIVGISSDPNYNSFLHGTTGPSLPVDDLYHVLLIGWDSVVGQVLASHDGVPIYIDDPGRSYGIPFSTQYGYPWAIGGPAGPGLSNSYSADHAFLGLLIPPSFIDPTDPNVIAHFWDSNNDVPLLLDQSGGALLADYGLKFQIWLQGAPPAFRRNLTNNQTQNGITQSDPNNEFQEVGGEGLQEATSSPWG